MSSTAIPTNELSVEDFRRLGVRPYEFRLSVIRNAATRSAQPLARQQLAKPSEENWLQLSRVATSAYRLMDPRLRANSQHRAHIGRILPMALSAAGKTRFQSLDRQRSTGMLESDFGHSPLNQSEVFGQEQVELGAAEATAEDLVWQISLDDDDLITRSQFRRGRSLRRRLTPWMMIVLGGLLIGSAWGWLSLTSRSSTTKPLIVDNGSFTSTSDLDPEVHGVAETAQLPEIKLPEVKLPEVKLPEIKSPEMQPSRATETETPSEELVETTDLYLDQLAASNETKYLDFEPAFIEGESAIPVDEFSIGMSGESDLVPSSSVINTVTPSVDSHDEGTVFPIPDKDKIRFAEQELWKTVNPAGELMTVDRLQPIRDSITQWASTSKQGSANHYAAQMSLARLVWLDTPSPKTTETIKRLVSEFEVDLPTVWIETYSDAAQHVTLPVQYDRFLSQGIWLLEGLIANERMDDCDQIIDHLKEHVNFASDFSADPLIDSYARSTKLAQRLASTIRRVIEVEGNIDSREHDVSAAHSSDASSLGRYYCLILGKWDIGLRFLTKNTDPRLAALAKLELGLHTDDPFFVDAQSWLEIAEQWFAVADRSSDRSADSIRLHAYELADETSHRAVGVVKLKLERKKEEWLQLIPSHRLPQVDATVPETSTSISTPSNDVDDDWLRGRIESGGEDLQAELQYQLGVTVSPIAWKSIRSRLRHPDEPSSIRLAGELRTKAEQNTSVKLSPPSDSIDQNVQIDGKQVDLDPFDHSAFITLSPGVHSLTWIIRLKESDLDSSLSCSIRDSDSGKLLRVHAPEVKKDAKSASDVTVSMLRSAD